MKIEPRRRQDAPKRIRSQARKAATMFGKQAYLLSSAAGK